YRADVFSIGAADHEVPLPARAKRPVCRVLPNAQPTIGDPMPAVDVPRRRLRPTSPSPQVLDFLARAPALRAHGRAAPQPAAWTLLADDLQHIAPLRGQLGRVVGDLN